MFLRDGHLCTGIHVPPPARNQLGQRVFLPHRLDRGTSGCLLLGFSPEAGKVWHSACGSPPLFRVGVHLPAPLVQCGFTHVETSVSRNHPVFHRFRRLPRVRALAALPQTPASPICCQAIFETPPRPHMISKKLNTIFFRVPVTVTERFLTTYRCSTERLPTRLPGRLTSRSSEGAARRTSARGGSQSIGPSKTTRRF